MIATRACPDSLGTRWRNALRSAWRGPELFAFAIAEVFVALLVTAAAGLALFVVGMILLPPAVRLLRRTADRARLWAGTWSGVAIDSPYRPPAPGRRGPRRGADWDRPGRRSCRAATARVLDPPPAGLGPRSDRLAPIRPTVGHRRKVAS